MAKKESESKLHEKKDGLSSKNSDEKKTKTSGAKKSTTKKLDLGSLPKTSKQNVGKNSGNEGLH